MPASAATKNTPPSTTSADEQGAATKPTSQHAPISPSTATTNSNPMPNAESSTSPSPPSKKDSDNKKRTIKCRPFLVALFATPFHFFHPAPSPIIPLLPIYLIIPIYLSHWVSEAMCFRQPVFLFATSAEAFVLMAL